MKRGFSPEECLLTLAARIDLEKKNRTMIGTILQNGAEWPKVMLYAKRFSIEPLLYRHLGIEEHSRYVPDDVLLALKKSYQLQAMRNMRIQGCIHQILRAMNENNIPVILLKGAFLATNLYPDIALRPMNDIDLLFRQEDILNACDLLIALGYDPPEPNAHQSQVHEQVSLDFLGEHLPPIVNRKIARIEIHSNIKGRKNQTLLSDLIWKKSIEHTTEGYCFRSLHPEHQILNLCVHLYQHIEIGSFTLYWFCDIHEMVRRHKESIHWGSLFHCARESGVENQVKKILGIMQGKWGTIVPDVCGDGIGLNLFELGDPKKNLRKAQKALVKTYYRKMKMVSSINGWGNRIVFVWKSIFPSRGNMIHRYHPNGSLSFFLYYILHPLVLIKRFAIGLLYNISPEGISMVNHLKRISWTLIHDHDTR